MASKTIGQILKEKRTELGLGLREAEILSSVSKLYIVALETDDYNAIPGEFYTRAYLKQYSEKMGLETDEILAAFDEKRDIQVEDLQDTMELYHFVKPADRVEEEEEERTWRNYLPLVILSAIAVLIIVAVGFAIFLNNRSSSNSLQADNYSLSSSSSSQASSSTTKQSTSSSASTASSSKPAQTLSVSGQGNAITATVNNAQAPVNVVFTEASGSSAWVSMTNSNMAANGVTLSDNLPTTTATLTEDSSTAAITLGNTAGLTIAVNGQNIDLSNLTAGASSTITLQVNYAK